MINKIKYIVKRILFYFYNNDFNEFMALYVQKRVLNNTDIVKMKRCIDMVKDCNLVYRLTDGTILGLYRDNGFIKHDDDVDIDVLNPTNDEIRLLKMKFKHMNIGREVIYKKKIQQIAYYDKEGFIFDIVFWYGDDNKIYNYCERDYERVQEAKYFKKEQMEFIEFHGVKYSMPTPIEEWLEMRYGKDWKTPKTYKGDWKEECFDMKRID